MMVAYVQEGRIIRLDADDRPDLIAAPQLRVRARTLLSAPPIPSRPLDGSAQARPARAARASLYLFHGTRRLTPLPTK